MKHSLGRVIVWKWHNCGNCVHVIVFIWNIRCGFIQRFDEHEHKHFVSSPECDLMFVCLFFQRIKQKQQQCLSLKQWTGRQWNKTSEIVLITFFEEWLYAQTTEKTQSVIIVEREGKVSRQTNMNLSLLEIHFLPLFPLIVLSFHSFGFCYFSNK